jgi:hypothetical protein
MAAFDECACRAALRMEFAAGHPHEMTHDGRPGMNALV